MANRLSYRVGDWVEVRSRAEILATLDVDGQLEGMPFMPEMFAFCGKRLKVSKSAHKTCDPVNGLHGRRLKDSVHLEDLRCDGAAHDGCQAGCLLFWKTAWLKRVEGPGAHRSDGYPPLKPHTDRQFGDTTGCTEADIERAIRKSSGGPSEPVYMCQATRVAAATTPISTWDLSQYLDDYRSGNAGLLTMVGSMCAMMAHAAATSGLGFGSVIRWAYDRFQKVTGGTPYPFRPGALPPGVRTPSATLDLQVGELVRIKDYKDVLDTLDQEWRNRGLYFDAEMAPFCGGTYRVLRRVERIIHEGTGKMLTFKTPAVILDGVACKARYAKHRKFCPRAYYQYCREVWLERMTDRES